jgi:hypothetical protein
VTLSAGEATLLYGYDYGELDDGWAWLRAHDHRYKRVHRRFLSLLAMIAAGEIDEANLPDDVQRAVRDLKVEGYLVAGAPVRKHLIDADIAIAPRLLAFAAVFVAATLVSLSTDRKVSFAGASVTPIAITLLALCAASVLHELGHWVACRRYFRAKIRLGIVSRVFPTIITETSRAWECPRNARVWINLAGPFVDLSLATLVGTLRLAVWPQSGWLAIATWAAFVKALFALNPLVEGDGYWCLCDWLGKFNLRKRGFGDLRALRRTRYSAYALASVLFVAIYLALAVRALWPIFRELSARLFR